MRITNTRAFRRILSAALTLVMALSLAVPAFAAGTTCDPGCTVCNSGKTRTTTRDTVPALVSFSDVPGTHTFYTGIIWCAEHGIVSGYSDGTFRPANTVTRSNFTVMLSRAFYADEVAMRNTESNLKYGAFFPNFVTLRINGILAGTSFSETAHIIDSTTMNKGINRYDMAQLMTNIMNKNGFSASSADKNAAIAKISDYNSIPSQYRDAVATVYALGIIGGYSDGSFGGEVTMNRGQAAVVIYRMINKMNPGGETGTPDPEAPVDPSTGDMACACVTLNGECKCCNTTSSANGNTGNTGTTTPTTPTTPSTGKTLVDGSAIIEANVMRLMEAKLAEWGNQPWPATGSANAYHTGSGGDVNAIVSTYRQYQTGLLVSCTGGCGGLATYLSDAAFGNRGFALRKISNADDVRAGDIIIQLHDGKITHIAVASGKDNTRDFGSYTVTNHGRYEANAGSVPGHSPNGINMQDAMFTTNYNSTTGISAVIYTRYPD